MIYRLLVTVVFLLSFSTHAKEVVLPSEQEITVEVYGNQDAPEIILWMHSERGISKELQKTLLSITKQQDIQIHLADWLDSYYITPSRVSLEEIPQQDFEDFIRYYTKQLNTSSKLTVVANGRMASLVLNAAHHLQSEGDKGIAGIILLSPYLQKGTPAAGSSAEYQKITNYSNLPLYIFQAERSPRFVPLPLLIKELEKGGSPIYTRILAGVSGGFHARDESDLTEADFQQKLAFPKQLASAIKLLKQTTAGPLKPLDDYKKNIRTKRVSNLRAVSLKTPELKLKDTQGKTHALNDYKGKTILVSFWASWCGPCIEEMPSLVKLQEKYKEKLQVLAVNIREDKATINKFTQAMNINFPLLQDIDSKYTKDWKVYVYPSNYIVDNKGSLVYAATGAMDWQDVEIEKILETVFLK